MGHQTLSPTHVLAAKGGFWICLACGYYTTAAEGRNSSAKKLVQETDELEGAHSIAELLGAAYDTLQVDLDELGVESVEDLKELDEEDIEALAAKLKKVQAKKFTKKIAALRA